jgi:2-hydroxy-6-oxonona-2,4-dienedioate hydrolase
MARLTLDGRPVCCQVLSPCGAAEGDSALKLPLLLLHGLGCSSEAWGPSLRCLERRGVDQPVFVPDMPGYGHSPGPVEALGMEELADWNARLLDALEIEQAHVAGNSMGCQVALALARRHPVRVGGMVLVGPTPGGHEVTPLRYLLGLLIDGCRETIHYNSTLLRMYLQMGFRRYMATVPKMLGDNPIVHAPAIAAPTLIMRGERDAIVPDESARELAERLPRSACQTIPGAAHAVQFTHPELFTRITLAFLDGVGRGESSPVP